MDENDEDFLRNSNCSNVSKMSKSAKYYWKRYGALIGLIFLVVGGALLLYPQQILLELHKNFPDLDPPLQFIGFLLTLVGAFALIERL